MIIIGGVIGSYAASCILEKNKESEIYIIEQHNPKEQPVHCAGLISKKGFERINVNPKNFVLNKIKGAKFYSENSKFEIRTNETKAYVIDRKKLDNFLLWNAIDNGAIFLQDYVKTIEIENGNFKIKTKNFEKYTKNLILATGTNYSLHKILNLRIPKFLLALQYEIPLEFENDMVELYFTEDFFYWVIPVENYARVGVATFSEPKQKLDKFIKKLKKERNAKEILSKQAGLIPIYDPKFKTEYIYKNLNLRLVGDAAAQLKATTGGGIVMGCIAAKKLYCENYEKEWRKEIGKELYIHLKIREFLNKNYKKIDKIFEFANNNKEIFEKSDMDIASVFIKNIAIYTIKHPKALIEGLKILS